MSKKHKHQQQHANGEHNKGGNSDGRPTLPTKRVVVDTILSGDQLPLGKNGDYGTVVTMTKYTDMIQIPVDACVIVYRIETGPGKGAYSSIVAGGYETMGILLTAQEKRERRAFNFVLTPFRLVASLFKRNKKKNNNNSQQFNKNNDIAKQIEHVKNGA